MDAKTLTEDMRDRLGRWMNPGYPERRKSLGDLQALTGITKPTLSRFLAGHPVSSETLDKLHEFLKERGQ